MIGQAMIEKIVDDISKPWKATASDYCRYIRWLLEERRMTNDTMDNMADNLIAEEKECSELRKSRDAAHHVIVRAGVVPGIDIGDVCRCDQCRMVANQMAEAGYLDLIKNRWWEEKP